MRKHAILCRCNRRRKWVYLGTGGGALFRIRRRNFRRMTSTQVQVEVVVMKSACMWGIRSRLALKVEGLARVSKNAGGRPRLASVAFDGRYMGLAL